MDEQNARASEETCPSTELNAESSNLSAADSVPLAEQIQPTHDPKTTGDKCWLHFANVTSPAIERFVDDNAHMKDATSVFTQDCLQEDAKDSGELPVCIESMEIVRLDPDRQLHASASADTDMIDSVQEDQVDVGFSMPDGQAVLTHVDGLQETGASHSVQESALFMMDEGRDQEASLEMLSVAVESFENMQKQSEEGLENVSNVLENPDFRKEHTANVEDASVEMEKDCINKSSMTKSTSESEDNESSVIDGTSAPSAEFQDKEHFLNMLCELAAVHQQEHEILRISKQVASCMTSLTDSDALCDEPRRLSFVDLLRKQMGHARAFTDLTPDAIYEEFLKQNQEFLGCKVDKDLNMSMSLASIFPNEGAVATLESKQKSNGTSYRKGDTPSTDEIVRDSKSGDIKFLEKGGGDSKEETRDGERSFVFGDLVWAKVKSHPWWPGQIFDAADASVAAKRIQRPGRTLVAFFGDGTFGWLQQSQLIPFMPNFAEKVKQTTMKSFCRAVAGALEEVSRRTELGLRCSHSDAVYSLNLFPDLNAGIRKGVRLRCHQDIEASKELFQPERVLKFLQTAACSPLYSLSSGLEYSKLCGHVYGFRSFMLSPKGPESKPTLLNMTKAQKKEKSVQSSELKRRLGQDEASGGPNLAVGKKSKWLHLSTDAGVKEASAGGKVQSPRFRSMETLLSSEAEDSKASESELKSHEQVQGSTWLAKGKRLHVSPDCKEKKRVRGWQSLGPLRDSKKLGLKTTVDTSASSDDDNRTLFDITGYHSLKKKKKGALKSTTDVTSKEVGQQLLKVKQELSKKQRLANLDETKGEELGLLDSGNSSLSMVVSQPDPSSPPVIEDSRNAKEGNKDTRDQLDPENAVTQDFKNAEKGVKDIQDLEHAEKGNEDTRDQFDLKDADVEVKEQIMGELVDLQVDCAENSKKQETGLLYLKADDAEENEKVETVLKAEVREESKETLDVKVAEKSEREDLKIYALEQSEKDEGELEVDNSVKKKTKRMHSDTGDTLNLFVKAKMARLDTRDMVKISLSSAPENEESVPRKSVKTSKLGLRMRKVAGALKGMPASLKSAKHIKFKDGLSAASASPKRRASAARSGVNDENFNSSLAKLLNILQVVAIDPLSSANMRSSLEGVTSVFLKFRNMVFLKSSGYAAATAAGKLTPSIANGHLSGDKKVDGKERSGRKTFILGMQQTGSKDSSVEQKALLKTESCSESIGGIGSQRLVEPDSFVEAKAVENEEHHPLGVTSGGQGSDVQNSSADNETANVETPVHGKIMTAGNQRPCVQDLAVAARKRKSEVLQKSATKVPGKSEALKGLPEKRLVEKKFNKERVADTRHYAKSVKHHISRAEGLSVSEKRSPMQSSGNAKVALGLFMQFPEDYTLPSATELRELFNQFGTLETFGIRVYKNASTAQVVFKNSDDAEVAWQHARKNRMFGQANVSYRLRHFSMSSKSESRLLTLTSARKGSLETRDLKSAPLQKFGRPFLAKQSTCGPEKVLLIKSRSPAGGSLLNRAQLDKGGLRVADQTPIDKITSSSCEPVPAHSPARDSLVSKDVPVVEQAPVQIGSPSRSEPVLAHSPASILQPTVPVPPCVSSSSRGPELGGLVGPPVMHEQEAIQSPSSQSALVTSFLNPPSVSNVNVSSGDIQDQMMKLLQQVSVIVSSTALTHKST